MLPPRKVRFQAKKMEKENYEFRTYLKCHADEEELDRQFLNLHNELFRDYDCNRCRNCCKMYYGQIPMNELQNVANHLELTTEELKLKYLDDESGLGN